MPNLLRLLFGVPFGVRQHFLSQSQLRKSCFLVRNIRNANGLHQTKAFSITAGLNKSPGRPSKDGHTNSRPGKRTPKDGHTKSQRPKSTLKDGHTNSQPPKPTPKHGYTNSQLPQSTLQARGPPKPLSLVSTNSHTFDWLSQAFPTADRVLLYVAPKHGAFYFTAYLFGAFLLFGGYNYADLILKDREGQPIVPWYTKSLGAVSTLILVCFGTLFILAPMKLVKSMSVVKAAEAAPSPWIVRMEVKPALPFMKPTVLETVPKKIFFDRNVPVFAQNLHFHKVQLKDHKLFTERYFAGKFEENDGSSRLSRFNQNMINVWPNMKKQVKRLFLRDQMAYVRIEGRGNFKLDLQQCMMLDHGRVFEKVAVYEDSAKPGIASLFRRYMA